MIICILNLSTKNPKKASHKSQLGSLFFLPLTCWQPVVITMLCSAQYPSLEATCCRSPLATLATQVSRCFWPSSIKLSPKFSTYLSGSQPLSEWFSSCTLEYSITQAIFQAKKAASPGVNLRHQHLLKVIWMCNQDWEPTLSRRLQ